MEDDTSLTPQEVAALLKIAKNTVYELIKRGELRSFKVGRKIRVDAKAVEELKGNSGSVSPQSQFALVNHTVKEHEFGFIICGQDGILDILSRYLENHPEGCKTYRSHKGSYNGLYALYKGEVNIATAHLWDGDSDIYNIPHVKMMLPGIKTSIIHLVKRMQGFYIKKGNPLNINDWNDLKREDLIYANREKGSGVRVLLDEHIRLLGLEPRNIRNYNKEFNSHIAVASAVARGEADFGLGNKKTALQVPGVDFIPLQEEGYQMVLLKDNVNRYPYNLIIEILNSDDFRNEIIGIGDYNIENMGKIVN